MAKVVKAFENYFLSYSSPAVTMGAYKQAANISCYSGTATVGQLLFYEGPVPVSHSDGKTIFLCFSTAQFPAIYDIVRNEKPLQLIFYTDKNYGSLSTVGLEPAGEGE